MKKAMRDEGLGGEELGELPAKDPRKIEIAMRLRTETMMTASWIANKLQITSVGYLNRLLYLKRKNVTIQSHKVKN